MSSAGEMDPRQLYSLRDFMEKYAVGELVDLQSFLSSLASFVTGTPIGNKLCQSDEQVARITEKTQRYLSLLKGLDLYVSAGAAQTVIDCFSKATREGSDLVIQGQNKADLVGALRKLADIVGDEMSVRLFLMLPARKASFFEQPNPLFGNDVADTFSAATSEDISEAGMCFALGRYTAVVFHLMRAMEAAVAALATKMQVTTIDKNGVQLSWGPIVSNMSGAVNAMQKGDEKNAMSEVLALLVHTKEAWRNTTMHPKQTYTEDQAKDVLDAVGSFMRRLAPLIYI